MDTGNGDSLVLSDTDHTVETSSFALSPYEYSSTLTLIWPQPSRLHWHNFRRFELLYNKVRYTSLPNYLSTRIPLESGLKIEAWREALVTYNDAQLVDFLEFGWPIDYTAPVPPTPTFLNHEKNPEFQLHIQNFFETELRHGAILGPFSHPPFQPWTQISPIMTRPKKDSAARRIVIDLSFPHNRSVNTGITKGWFQGAPFSFALPTIADLVKQVKEAGKGCYIWSADLARAYRQLRVCPLSVPLLGLKFKDQYYLDLAPSFGCRISAMACARTTAAVSWLLKKKGYKVLRYIDDFAAAEKTYTRAQDSYKAFMELTEKLGLTLSKEKCIPPTKSLTWLGYTINTETLTLTLPNAKIQEAIELCQFWLTKRIASRKEVASLFGSLSHIATCVPPAARFLARILQTLRQTPFEGFHPLPEYINKDIIWFIKFAQLLNGVVLIPPTQPITWVIECDSSLSGAGAFSDTHFYAEKYTNNYISQGKPIHQLEALNIVHALKYLLPDNPSNYKIILNTDNTASQCILNSGMGKDPILAACSRQLWLLAAQANTDIQVLHKPGQQLVLADALSRSHSSEYHKEKASSMCRSKGLRRIRIEHDINILDPDL